MLNTPNKITIADFEGWIQERGIYFWSTFSAPYQPLLGLRTQTNLKPTAAWSMRATARASTFTPGFPSFASFPRECPAPIASSSI